MQHERVRNESQLCTDSVVRFFGPILCWGMDVLVATTESMGRNNPERMGDSCRAGIRAPLFGWQSCGQPYCREPNERTAENPRGSADLAGPGGWESVRTDS